MTLIQAVVLGIVQGLTEFIPVSSSAHLVLIPYLLGWKFSEEQVLPFGTLVQLGTLAAVIIYFWADLWGILKAFVAGLAKGKPFTDLQARLGWLLILATIPAGVMGLLLKRIVAQAFNSVTATAVFLLLTAAILVAAEWIGQRSRSFEKIGWLDALWMGIAQALAIFPGLSRSGATMASGLARHLDRPAAARFSFLMSVPVMLAAGAMELKDVLTTPGLAELLPAIGVGFIAATAVGYLSIRWLLRFVSTHSFRPFAVYCAAVGVFFLLISIMLK